MKSDREPIKNTCPDINRYIRSIKGTIIPIRDLRNYEYDDLLKASEQMLYELENCIDYLEELREANHKLRIWGNEEAERVDDLEKELSKLEKELEAL